VAEAAAAAVERGAESVGSGGRGQGVRNGIIIGLALAAVAVMTLVFARGFGTDPHAVPFMLNGAKATTFKMQRLDTGEMVNFDDFKGKPVVINFWATWCGPCKLEHPVLQYAAEKYKDRVIFLGIVFEDTEDNTRRFLRQNGATYPQLYDAKSTVAVDYGVSGVPETYFIDKSGTILGKYANPIDVRTMEERIKDIL
jgi:cytochrome c biogenesis protein CcmG, thiol:disulfide interchange protein DsbE